MVRQSRDRAVEICQCGDPRMTAETTTRRRRFEAGIGDGSRLCSKCDKPNDRPPHRYCRACHGAYMRGWRAGRVMVKIEDLTEAQRNNRRRA